jgi:hypothetical protein
MNRFKVIIFVITFWFDFYNVGAQKDSTWLLGIGILGGSFSESRASPFISQKGHRKKELIPYLAGKAGGRMNFNLKQ